MPDVEDYGQVVAAAAVVVVVVDGNHFHLHLSTQLLDWKPKMPFDRSLMTLLLPELMTTEVIELVVVAVKARNC